MLNQNSMIGQPRRSRRRASFQTPSKKFKGNSCYIGSENEEENFNDFTMNVGFIQYSVTDDCSDKWSLTVSSTIVGFVE